MFHFRQNQKTQQSKLIIFVHQFKTFLVIQQRIAELT